MPGVPSGRGCKACRAQKKKCDQAKPACARCTRLNIPCIGAGQQRYIFKEETGRSEHSSSPSDEEVDKGVVKRTRYVVTLPTTPLSNELSILNHMFVNVIKPATDLRFNMVWSYGTFLQEIPRRLGKNEVLDRAVDCLVHAHADFCALRRASASVLAKYSYALNKLRTKLDDPDQAQASETVCGVMLLLIAQSYIGTSGQFFSGHCAGLARILKARRFYDPKDTFETQLLASVRGPVIFEGILNPAIDMTPEEWKSLVENPMDGDLPEAKIITCMAHVRLYIDRGRKLRMDPHHSDPRLLNEMWTDYQALVAISNDLRTRYMQVQGRITQNMLFTATLAQAHAHVQRFYALSLAVTVVLSCVLGAIDTANYEELNKANNQFAQQVLILCEHGLMYGPLGCTWIPLVLYCVQCGTTDPNLREAIRAALIDYKRRYPGGQDVLEPTPPAEMTSRILNLELPLEAMGTWAR